MKRSTFQAIIFSLLTIAVAAVIVMVFFMDHQLKALGYTPEQINSFKKYHIEDEVKTYNPALLIALESDQFDKNKVDYYVLFEYDSDVTRDINDLADMYSLEEYSRLLNSLSPDEMLMLVFKDRINNLDSFLKIKEHGYDVDMAYIAQAGITGDYLQHFLVSPIYSESFLDSYIKLANTGYSFNLIDCLYERFNEEDAAIVARFKKFDRLEELMLCEEFKMDNCARYLWYAEKYSSLSSEQVVSNVNKNRDVPASISYSSLYNNTTVLTDPDPLYLLVDKQHRLADDWQPPELVNIDPEYRGNNTPVNRDALEHFKEMSDAYKESHTKRLICQDGYISFEAQQALYETTVESLAEVDQEDTVIDTFMARGGYSEHQTGLALNITEKDTSIYNVQDTAAVKWLESNAHEYGFILRYPKGKDFITGYSYIPYHYRYVGEENAVIMHKYNWTYEEFYYLIIIEHE